MRKKMNSFRFSEETNSKLEELYEKELKRSEAYGVPKKSRNQLVEEAIDLLYLKNMDLIGDNNINQFMSDMIDSKIRLAIKGMTDSMKHLLINSEKTNRYLNCISQSEMMAYEDLAEVKEVVNDESVWEKEINKWVGEKFR